MLHDAHCVSTDVCCMLRLRATSGCSRYGRCACRHWRCCCRGIVIAVMSGAVVPAVVVVVVVVRSMRTALPSLVSVLCGLPWVWWTLSDRTAVLSRAIGEYSGHRAAQARDTYCARTAFSLSAVGGLRYTVSLSAFRRDHRPHRAALLARARVRCHRVTPPFTTCSMQRLSQARSLRVVISVRLSARHATPRD